MGDLRGAAPSIRPHVWVTHVEKDPEGRISSKLISVSGSEVFWIEAGSLVAEKAIQVERKLRRETIDGGGVE